MTTVTTATVTTATIATITVATTTTTITTTAEGCQWRKTLDTHVAVWSQSVDVLLVVYVTVAVPVENVCHALHLQPCGGESCEASKSFTLSASFFLAPTVFLATASAAAA